MFNSVNVKKCKLPDNITEQLIETETDLGFSANLLQLVDQPVYKSLFIRHSVITIIAKWLF